MLKLKRCNQVSYDAPHCAFTDIAWWRGAWYLVFRAAASHIAAGGKIVVMTSADLTSWSQVTTFSSEADHRDAKLLATPERLIVYQVTCAPDCWQPLLYYTEDACTWTGPIVTWEKDHVQWRPKAGPDGQYYCCIHAGGSERQASYVDLCRSADGLQWEQVSRIRASGGNESDLTFTPNGDCIALLRSVDVPKPGDKAVLASSSYPYTSWELRDAGIPAHGPALMTLGDIVYAAARKYRWSPSGEQLPSVTALYLLAGGLLHEFLTLPSGGDCSYAGWVVHDDNQVAMSYYSSHEGTTGVYIAQLEQLPSPSDYGYLAAWKDQAAS